MGYLENFGMGGRRPAKWLLAQPSAGCDRLRKSTLGCRAERPKKSTAVVNSSLWSTRQPLSALFVPNARLSLNEGSAVF